MPLSKLTNEGKDIALIELFADVKIGLIRDEEEIQDIGYFQQILTISEPQSPEQGGRAVVNTTDIHFGPWQLDSPSEITGWFIEGRRGVLAIGELSRPYRPRSNDELVIHVGDVVLRLS